MFVQEYVRASTRVWNLLAGKQTVGSTLVLETYESKIGHLILYSGINNECLETTIHLHPRTQTQRHTQRHTHTQTHTSIHVFVHQDIVGICVAKTADGWSHGRDLCEFNSRPVQIWANSPDDKPPFLASKVTNGGGRITGGGRFKFQRTRYCFGYHLQQAAEFHHFCDSE